jgi:thermostable 8-oxoguanine DNA glycosylase
MFHFLSPNYFPIIDSKVITAWNEWFPKHKLPKKITVQKYLEYADLMREWSKNTGVSLRELELSLFEYEK